MKRTTLRLTAAMMAAVLLATLIAGCKRNNDEESNNGVVTPEFVYVAEYMNLPDDVTDISNLTIIGEKLYFSSQVMIDEETYTYASKLFSMNIDGTGMAELANYSPGENPEGAMGSDNIQSFSSDGDGNLWVVETGYYYGFDLPEDFDEETDEMWMYQYEIGNKTAVRKLDATGAELLSVDIGSLASNTDYFYVRTLSIDGDGNIYLVIDQTIYVLDSSGKLLFKLEVENWVEQLLRMSDGSIAMFGYFETGRALRKINFATRDWGEDVEMPMNAYNLMPGGGEYSFLYTDNNNLFGFDLGTGESIKLLNWLDSDISNDGLNNITMLPDSRIMCTLYTWDYSGESRPIFELVILTKVPYDSLPKRTILTLACIYLDWSLRSTIVDFNKTNEKYRIQVNEYYDPTTEDAWQAGLTKLSTEIISGTVPDIMLLSSLPYNQYVSRGLLEDLYKYIDSDQEFGRSDFIESAFRAMETNGHLYQIFPNFSVSTLFGHPKLLGEGMGWNMDEFREALRANPQADYPIGQYMTKANFLQLALTRGMDEYVDWTAGKCYFDSGGFAQLLEFANTFPEEIDWENTEWIDMAELLATGRQIMVTYDISDFLNTQMYKAQLGGEIVFKGFPTESRTGNTISPGVGIAMTTRCRDKEGAWEFMRTILTEDFQRSSMRWNFPTNKAVFDEMLTEAMTPEYYIDEDGNEVEVPKLNYGMAVPMPAPRSRGGVSVSASSVAIDSGYSPGEIVIYAMTQEEADQIMALIDSMSGSYGYDERLMEIVSEGAEDYFNGRRTAQDAAGVIQSRASIYVAEQS